MGKEDDSSIQVLVGWMRSIDGKLEAIHTDLGDKVDRSELADVEKKVDSANKKINYFAGAWSVASAAVLAFFGFKDSG